jgi:type IV secretion system protein VirD4
LSFVGERTNPPVRINPIHCAIIAPTGVGKGASFVIPHLLSCPESVVVVDFKGENYLATAKARQRMGQRIVVLDPFHVVTHHPDTFNPLDFIDASSPLAIDDCRALAEALVIRTGQEREPHWNDGAEMNIGGITSFVVQHAPRDDRSLQTVRDLLSNPEEMAAAIEVMCQSSAWEGMLARMGHQLTHFKGNELASTLTTTGRFLRFLDTLAIAESTRRSSFNPADLLSGKTTVYLILPPEHMRTQSALLRLWIGSMVRTVIRGGLQTKRKVHFILDEAASCGHLDCLDEALVIGRGFGLRVQWYFQSLGQLKQCFPEGQDVTLLSNTTQVYFGVNDYSTAEHVSARLGDETIVIESGGVSRSRTRQTPDYGSHGSTSYSVNSSENWQQGARRLLKPEEVLGLSERVAITFTPGIPPIATTLVRYYEKGFREQSDLWTRMNVYYVSVVGFLFSIVLVLGALGMNIHYLFERQSHETVAPESGLQGDGGNRHGSAADGRARSARSGGRPLQPVGIRHVPQGYERGSAHREYWPGLPAPNGAPSSNGT